MPIRISTVIPVYNGQRFLERSLNALLAQTVKPSEIIIANDASTDDTPLIAQAYQRRYPKLIRIIHNSQNKGINWTINRCIFEEVRNDYIFPTACDDMVLSDFIEKSLTALNMNPEAGICFCKTYNVQEQAVDEFFQKLKPHEDSSPLTFYRPDELVRHIRNGLCIPTNTMVINRKFAIDTGGYIETLKWHADLMLAYVMAFRYGAVVNPSHLAVRTYRGDSFGAGHTDIDRNIEIYENFLYLLRTIYRDCYNAFVESNFFRIWHYRISEGVIRTPSMWNVDNLRLCINQLLQWAALAKDNFYGVFLEEILASPQLFLKEQDEPFKSSLFAISCLNAIKTDIYDLTELVYKNISNLLEKGYSATTLNILQRRLKKERYRHPEGPYYSVLLTIENFISQAKSLYQHAIDLLIRSNNYNTAELLLDNVYQYFKDEVNVLLFKAFLYNLKGQKQLSEEFKLKAQIFKLHSIFRPTFTEIEPKLCLRQ